jgi:hypothetical protein
VSAKLNSDKQECRFLLLQCHTPPCSSLFAAVYKIPLKEEEGLLLGFLVLLWAFWCGMLLEGKRIVEGKRVTQGNLLKGKEWLKWD